LTTDIAKERAHNKSKNMVVFKKQLTSKFSVWMNPKNVFNTTDLRDIDAVCIYEGSEEMCDRVINFYKRELGFTHSE